MIPKRLKFVSVDRYDVTIDLNGIKVPYPPLGKALFAELNDLLDISALVVQKKNAFSYYSRKARLRQLSLLEVTHRLAELVIGFDFYYSYKDKHYYFSRKKASFSPKSQVALFHSAKRKTIVGLFQVSSAQGQIVLLKPILLDKKIPPKNFSPVKVFQ